jgi:hypothetical protein
MTEFILDLAEVTPLKLIISQVIIWGIAVIYTFRAVKKSEKDSLK